MARAKAKRGCVTCPDCFGSGGHGSPPDPKEYPCPCCRASGRVSDRGKIAATLELFRKEIGWIERFLDIGPSNKAYIDRKEWVAEAEAFLGIETACTSPPFGGTARKIVNTIGWRTPWLHHVVGFCCRELDYPAQRIAKATFRKAHNCRFRGWADLRAREIRIKINPVNSYPLASGRERDLPSIPLADAAEVLVLVTAHEIAHLVRWDRFVRQWKQQGKRDACCERDTEAMARAVLSRFRDDRLSLLADWGESGDGPVPPSYAYRLSCESCGYQYITQRPMRQMFCLACQGDYVKSRTPDMPPPRFLECRRVPLAEASA